MYCSYLGANGGGSNPNSAVGNQGATLLNMNITDMKNKLAAMNVNLPVGTSDAGAYFNTEVLENVDYGVRTPPPRVSRPSYMLTGRFVPDSVLEHPPVVRERVH